MRSQVLITALAASLLLAAGSPGSAAPGRWRRIGPEGGDVCALAAAPSRPGLLYAGLAQGGVFRSADGGRNWSFAGRGLGKANSACLLAVDPVRPATVWAGTSQGLFKSTDSGASWTRKGTQITDSQDPAVSAVAVHPRQPGVLWAAVHSGGFFQTRDGGATWRSLGAGAPHNVSAVAVDPIRPSTLYAGTVGQGAFKSTDGGVHWKHLSIPLNPHPIETVQQIVLDPGSPRTLFVTASLGHLFKSANGGASWRQISPGLGDLTIRSLAIDPASPAVLYAATNLPGVFQSTNGGSSWQPVGPGLPSPFVQSIVATRTGVLAGSADGVAFSTDRGASWQKGRGLLATLISSLAVSAQDPPRIYAARFDRVWKTADHGGFWLPITPPIQSTVTGPVALDPEDQQTVYLGLISAFARSADGGRQWSALPGFDCMLPTRIVIDPSTPGTLYAGGSLLYDCLRKPDVCLTFKSADSGATWSCIKNDLPSRGGSPVLALDPFAPAHLYTSDREQLTSEIPGLYHSLDGGAHWALLTHQITANDLAFSAHTPGLVYAAVDRGVGRSTDAGSSWEIHRFGLPPNEAVLHLALDPNDPSILYAATANQVLRSNDAGSTWKLAGPGLEEVQIFEIGIDPSDPKILYAATAGGGVMMLEQEE